MTTDDGWQDHRDPAKLKTLRNKFALTDQRTVEAVEAQVSALRIAEIVNEPLSGNFDFGHYCALHSRLLGDTFDWAGRAGGRWGTDGSGTRRRQSPW